MIPWSFVGALGEFISSVKLVHQRSAGPASTNSADSKWSLANFLQSSWRSSMIEHDRHYLKDDFFFSLFGCWMFGNFGQNSGLDKICVSNSYFTLTDKINSWSAATQDYEITSHCEIINNQTINIKIMFFSIKWSDILFNWWNIH